MRAMLNYLIGVSERTLLTSWVKASRGNSSNDSINTLDRFVQSLFMRLDNFALFLGFSPNRVIAREFVRFGGFRINEKVVTNVNYALCANDIFQVSLTAKSYLRNLYGTRVSKFGLETRIRYVHFLQVN